MKGKNLSKNSRFLKFSINGFKMSPEEGRGINKMSSQNPSILRNSYQFPLEVWRDCSFIFLFQRGKGWSRYRLRHRTRVKAQILGTTQPTPFILLLQHFSPHVTRRKLKSRAQAGLSQIIQ